MKRHTLVLGAVVLALSAAPAQALDPSVTFKHGTYVLSGEGGGGDQNNLEGHRFQTGLEFWNAGVRIGILPFDPILPGPLRGSLEVGLEPFFQNYTAPRSVKDSFFFGLGAAARYHFVGLAPFLPLVPYIEGMAAAGGTDLETREIRSTFTFLLHAGAGLEFFVTDHVSVYGGYRLQHVSNGNIESPNRGFESHTGVGGLSIFFP